MNFPKRCLIFPAFFWLVLLIFYCSILPCYSSAEEIEEYKVTLIVSRHIKPYMDALQGFRQEMSSLNDIDLSIHVIDQHDPMHYERLKNTLSGHNHDVLVAIGPEATSLSWHISHSSLIPVIYSMVLDPEKLAGDDFDPACGISLNIPAPEQMDVIRRTLPDAKRLGVLFDPQYNMNYFTWSSLHGKLVGLDLVPLTVSSSRLIPEVLSSAWNNIDALWFVPDQTVISQTVVEFIIKEALLHGKPVVGYNRFFYDSGAALAFALDFEEIGRQSAQQTIELLRRGACVEQDPHFEALVNTRVFRSLDLRHGGVSQ